MKTLIETRPKVTVAKTRVLCVVASGLVWFSATAAAQTFTILKSFGNLTNIAGANPRSQLAQGPDGTLYGTASDAEGSVQGTIFKFQPDGSGFAGLKWFTNSIEGVMLCRPNRQGWAAVRSDSSSANAATEEATAWEMVLHEQHRRTTVLKTAPPRK